MPADVVFSRAETYELEDTKSKEDIVSYEEIGISNAAAMYGELGTLDFSNDATRYQVVGKPNDAGDYEEIGTSNDAGYYQEIGSSNDAVCYENVGHN